MDTESDHEEFRDVSEMQYNNPVYSSDRDHVFKEQLHFDFTFLPRALKLKEQLRRRKILCASVVIFLILALATCLVILVTLSFKKGDHVTETDGGNQVTIHLTNTAEGNSVTNGHASQVYGSLYIVNYNYSTDYGNNHSDKYTSLVAIIRNQVEIVVSNSEVADDYSKTTVTRFRSGSIISDIILHFKTEHSSRHLVDQLTKALENSFSATQDYKTSLGPLQVHQDRSYFTTEEIVPPSTTEVSSETIVTTPMPTKATDKPIYAQCEPIQTRTCLSGDVSYSFTGFPNFFGHQSQQEAELVLANVRWFLMSSSCYAHAEKFVCSVLVPDCEKQRITPPCREMCHDFYRKCGSKLPMGFQTIDCGSFPSQEIGNCIQAPPIPDLKVRLRSDDVDAPYRGVAEVEIFPLHWNTVCGHSWSGPDGDIFCKQMNYSYAMKTWTEQTVNLETFIFGVNCLGSETNVAQCEILMAGDTPLPCTEVAMVECGRHNEENTDIAVRLAGGTATQGRVEVFGAGKWGTICDDNFGKTEAQVVCRMLGFKNGDTVTVAQGKAYGAINLDILLDDVTCTGTEENLGDCEHSHWDQHNCLKREAVGVSCDNTEPAVAPIQGPTTEGPPPHLEVRLVSGEHNDTGRLEIRMSNERVWGTVCKDLFDHNSAQVFCRMLGFSMGTYEESRYGPGTGPIKMNYVYCQGTEDNVSECLHDTTETQHCSHYDDVSISCK